MARKSEDMIRRMMGMPPREKQSTRQRKQRQPSSNDEDSASSRRSRSQGFKSRTERRRRRNAQSVAALMQAVAVDVTFTEIREFSSTVIGEDGGATVSYAYEEQISDVTFVEIKEKRS